MPWPCLRSLESIFPRYHPSASSRSSIPGLLTCDKCRDRYFSTPLGDIKERDLSRVSEGAVRSHDGVALEAMRHRPAPETVTGTRQCYTYPLAPKRSNFQHINTLNQNIMCTEWAVGFNTGKVERLSKSERGCCMPGFPFPVLHPA